MKTSLYIPILFATSVFLLFINGAGRHDVKLTKYAAFANNKEFDCVGSVYDNQTFQFSCVLIDKTHIITAAHAFEISGKELVFDSVYEPMLNKWRYGKHSIKTTFGEASKYYVKLGHKKYRIKKIVINEVYQNATAIRDRFGVHPSPEMNFDIAIAELETEVTEIAPAVLYNDSNELNQKALLAGFGEVAKANDVNKTIGFRLRRKLGGENIIDSIGGYKVGNTWANLFFDFDAPHSDCCNRMGSAQALPLEYFPNGGDCGSGLFIPQNGRLYLAGICASDVQYWEFKLYGEKYGMAYGFTCNYQRIYAYRNWINEILRHN